MRRNINAILFLIIIFGLGIVLLTKEDTLISKTERRLLEKKPKVTKETIINGDFNEDYETYLLDQFPLRDNYRNLKSFANYKIFNKLEYQDIILYNDYAIKLPMEYDYSAIDNSMGKINAIQSSYFSENDCYFVLVPDKSCFLDDYSTLVCNYDLVEKHVKENLSNISYIDIKNNINLDCYYKGDSHWSQEKIVPIANTILENMGQETKDISYLSKRIPNFNGVFKSQAALNTIKEDIVYLTNSNLDKCIVFNYETNKNTSIYDLGKLEDEKSLDMYDIFLSGASPLLRVDNPNAYTNKTLYVFRDSFGSSLSPLLVEYYETTYIIDLRYIQSNLLKNFITFDKNGDVLFLYSTTMINIPNNIK